MLFGPPDVKPGEIVLQGLGSLLHDLMRLRDIPNEDVAKVAMPLRPE